MFQLLSSRRMAVRRGLVAFVMSVAAGGLAGCAAKAPSSHVSANIYPGTQARVAGYHAPSDRVEIEADGLPTQGGPMRSRKPEPDDPTEPFSPNYGRVIPLKQADAAAKPVYVPNDLPPAFRASLAKSVAGS